MAKKDSRRINEIREKANQQRREQQKAERRKTILIQAGIALGILVVVAVVVGAILLANASRTPTAPPSASGTISVLGVDGVPLAVAGSAVTLGQSDAPVSIDVYEDYSCPHCADYEAAVGQTLLQLISKGEAVVSFHPIRIVTSYGTAAGSAAACVAEEDAQSWPDFHSALFANHSQTTDGWGAKDFAGFAQSLGITDERVLNCITDERYEDWIVSNTDAARSVGISSTPSLVIDGELQSKLLGPEELVAAVDRAKG